MELVNRNFADAEIDLNRRDFIMAHRFGKKHTDKPRPVRAIMDISDWIKGDLLRNRSLLKGSHVYFKENLSREMQLLDFNASERMKKGDFICDTKVTFANHPQTGRARYYCK